MTAGSDAVPANPLRGLRMRYLAGARAAGPRRMAAESLTRKIVNGSLNLLGRMP